MNKDILTLLYFSSSSSLKFIEITHVVAFVTLWNAKQKSIKPLFVFVKLSPVIITITMVNINAGARMRHGWLRLQIKL